MAARGAVQEEAHLDSATILGLALIAAGVMDCLVAVAFVGPRIPEPGKRQVVVMAVASGGAMMVLVGVAFLLGVIPMNEPG